MQLEIGKIYKSLAGCPVKLLALFHESEEYKYPSPDNPLMARVEYIDPVNNYGYGQGAIGMFLAKDLTEWEVK